MGSRENAKIEKIQIQYIRWTLYLHRRTSGYIVMTKTNRETIRIKTGRRAMKFKEVIRTSMYRLILKKA